MKLFHKCPICKKELKIRSGITFTTEYCSKYNSYDHYEKDFHFEHTKNLSFVVNLRFDKDINLQYSSNNKLIYFFNFKEYRTIKCLNYKEEYFNYLKDINLIKMLLTFE